MSSTIWSLAIDADDGLVDSAGVEGEEEAGVASDFLVLAEPDEEEGDSALAAVGWTASGVVVLVFVGAVVAWM